MQEIGSFIIDIVDLFAMQMKRVQGFFLRIDLRGALLMVLIGFYRINVSRSWSFEHFSSDQLQRMHRMQRIIGSSDLRITPQRWDQKKEMQWSPCAFFWSLFFLTLSLSLTCTHAGKHAHTRTHTQTHAHTHTRKHTRVHICTNALVPWHLWTNLT